MSGYCCSHSWFFYQSV